MTKGYWLFPVAVSAKIGIKYFSPLLSNLSHHCEDLLYRLGLISHQFDLVNSGEGRERSYGANLDILMLISIGGFMGLHSSPSWSNVLYFEHFSVKLGIPSLSSWRFTHPNPDPPPSHPRLEKTWYCH